MLLVHGTDDQFTGARAFQSYAAAIMPNGQSNAVDAGQDNQTGGNALTVISIDGADHFYASRKMLDALKLAFDDWI